MAKVFNDTLRNKLQNMRPTYNRNNTGHKQNFMEELPPVSEAGIDGLDHINIWVYAETDLGKALSHMADIPFTHSRYGRFRSVEGFWHYIRSVARDDRLRMMVGYKAKKVGDTFNTQRVNGFKALIMEVNYLKVKQCQPLFDELKQSDTPFEMYYIYRDRETQEKGVRIRPSSATWLIKGFEELRKAIKENREPNFNILLDAAEIRRVEQDAELLKQEKLEEQPPIQPERVPHQRRQPPPASKFSRKKNAPQDTVTATQDSQESSPSANYPDAVGLFITTDVYEKNDNVSLVSVIGGVEVSQPLVGTASSDFYLGKETEVEVTVDSGCGNDCATCQSCPSQPTTEEPAPE